MKTFFNTLLLTLLILSGCRHSGQNHTPSANDRYNLSFELIENDMPKGWQANGNDDYVFSIDSSNVKNGKYAATIEHIDGTSRFGIWGLIIRENYDGKRITLSGYVKTENVDGYASLLLRIDPEIGVKDIKINGTTEWKRYEVSVGMNPSKTRNFAIGAMLVGKGKVWFDDLKISIDGKDIAELKPIEQNKLNDAMESKPSNESNIVIGQLNNNQIEDLHVLGMIWGFLKYYHPNIASGMFNWDNELFKILPEILNVKNKIERDKVLIKWINTLGDFLEKKEEDVDSSYEIKQQPDLDWINNERFSKKLSSLLLKIKNAERTNESHYIGYGSFLEPNFKNEESYLYMKYPDTGFRLLSLYRYWNIIQYYFPYKYLMEEDWKDVLKEFIPKIVNTGNETEYTLTVLELIGRICDSHANIMNNQVLDRYFGEFYAPIDLSFVENQMVVSGYRDEKAGRTTRLEMGDIITKIDQVPIDEAIKKLIIYTPASNNQTQLRDIAMNLLRTNDSVINVEFIRNGIIQTKSINTEKVIYSMNSKFVVKDTCYKRLSPEIAYINNGSLKKEYLSKIWEEIKNTKGLIIDNRNYPFDHPFFEISRYLLPDSLPYFQLSIESIITPGQFVLSGPVSIGHKNDDYYKGKVIILVNEMTQSSAETHTMMYKLHPNSLITGSATAGANGDVSFFYLPGGIYTSISGHGVYYPDGNETQRIGIVPDIEVKPTIQGIKEGRDEVLDKAIEILTN